MKNPAIEGVLRSPSGKEAVLKLTLFMPSVHVVRVACRSKVEVDDCLRCQSI